MPEVKRSSHEQTPQPVVIKKESERELLSWSAPSRPFKRRTRQFYVTLFSIAGLMILILLFMSEFLPILLIISMVFLYYVMSTVEPGDIAYTITSRGVKVADQRTDWEQLGRFWFTRRFDNDLLVIEAANLTGRLELVLTPEVKDKAQKVLSSYLTHEEIPPSFLDKSASWVSDKFSAK